MAVRTTLSERELSAEKKNPLDAQRAAAKPKANAKVKANAQPKKEKAFLYFRRTLPKTSVFQRNMGVLTTAKHVDKQLGSIMVC